MDGVIMGCWAVVAGVFGSAVGSHLGVVLDRVPAGRDVRESSRCAACGTAIRLRDNLPVVSYLWLRGRCRSCQGRIPPVWWLLEVGLGVVWATAAAALRESWVLLPVLILSGAAVAYFGLAVAARRRPAGSQQRWRWAWFGVITPVVLCAVLAVLAGSVLQGSGQRLTVLAVAAVVAAGAVPLTAPSPRRPAGATERSGRRA